MNKLFNKYKQDYKNKEEKILSLEKWTEAAKDDSSLYSTSAERMLKAIGEPEIVDTAKDPRSSRVFGNREIRRYKPFHSFYGIEDPIERIVSFFRHAAQNLEESRQILYLLGPVGSAKSSIAETLKSLMETQPISILTSHDGTLSPLNESPLGLFSPKDSEELGIPKSYLNKKLSPWALKRLKEYQGDISKFKVAIVHPSQDHQIGITKTEPGDENNQDISTLVGKLDIRKLEFFSQNDPDAYNYSGGLCLSNQGILDFVEMFKAPIKVLHPLLTATQEKNYNGTESIGALPYEGIVVAHSNEAEWESFKTNKNNEAFLDRIFIVEVPYCLRISEEVEIYKKLIASSTLSEAPCAPSTLEMLAQFAIMTRIDKLEDDMCVPKMLAYDGQNVRERDNKAKSLHEYKLLSTPNEGFYGVSTRLAYKILAEVYNFDPTEVAADPVHLMYVLHKTIKAERYPEAKEADYMSIVDKWLAREYSKKVGKDLQTAYLDSYDEYGQALFERYIKYADHWISDTDYRDPDTGQMFNRKLLNAELEKLEKPAGIANSKDFRHEIVNFSLRHQATHKGKNPDWKSYEKLRNVIEATMFSKTEDLLPVISFGGHASNEDKKKHQSFVKRMQEMGYTEKQTRRVLEWHSRYSKAN